MELRKVQSERVEVSFIFQFGQAKISTRSSLGWEDETLGYGGETKFWGSDG
jgi:hypothetical protein